VKSAADITSPADTAPETPEPSRALRAVRWAGYALLGVQLVAFGFWSVLLFQRFSLSMDFAMANQAFFEIAHGNLNPVNSILHDHVWQDHSAFIEWPQALFYWIFPNSVTLLWLQDTAVVVAEAVAFTWICELAQKYRPGRPDAALLAAVGLVLLLINPWIWWTVSFDWHDEALAVMFLVLLARDMAHHRRRAWVWVVPLLACGDVGALYAAAAGLSAILAGRRSRLPGLGITGLGLAWLAVIRLIHGDVGTPVDNYEYLQSPAGAPFSLLALAKGMILHPGRVWLVFWTKRSLLWQNVSSAGVLGLAFIWALPVVVSVLGPNTLMFGPDFARPSFQNLPLYVLLPVGTVAVLGWLATRPAPQFAGRRITALVAALAAVLVLVPAVTTAATWGPRVKSSWLLVDSITATTLRHAQARIPGSAEVVVSQGVAGRFSSRKDVQALKGPGVVRLDSSPVYFVIVPYEGIEPLTPEQELHIVSRLSGPLHARLLLKRNNVWVFRWTPSPGQTTLTVP
jgi:Predicted membrane protein (DUF2079)